MHEPVMPVLTESGPVAGSDMHDPGMPSNHAQFSFFLCVYFSAYLMTRCVARALSIPMQSTRETLQLPPYVIDARARI